MFIPYYEDSTNRNYNKLYILFKTNHHSLSRFKRNNTSSNLYRTMENNINESINEIISSKYDYINFMKDEKDNYIAFKNEEKEKFDNWFTKFDKEYNDFMNNSRKNLSNLEKTYSEKLKVEEPSKFMLEKSNEYKKKTIH